MIDMSPSEVDTAIKALTEKILYKRAEPIRFLLGIPRGGMSVAYAVAREIDKRKPDWPDVVVARADPHYEADPASLVIDDVVETGKTLQPYADNHWQTASLVWKFTSEVKPTYWGIETDGWVKFPWDEQSKSPEDAVVRILEYLEVNPSDPSLLETPRRFLSWLSEFKEHQPEPEITTFAGVQYDQMVVVRDIPFTSLCEHHLLPFIGTVAVAYVPDESVIGLSKLARIAQFHARRLQVQERMTQQILDSVLEATKSRHVGVIVKAEHTCMSMRGPKAEGHSTITSALYGDFRSDAKTREELLKLTGC